MIILHIATTDPAGSIIRTANAINAHTEHICRVLTFRKINFLGYNDDIYFPDYAGQGYDEVEWLIENADLYVLHKPHELQIVKWQYKKSNGKEGERCLLDMLAGKVILATAQTTVNQLEHSIEQIERYINARLVTEVLMLDLPRISEGRD